MPIPLPDLDDRRFDDLVQELRERLQHHLPELAEIAEGDPLYALTDLFAWLTETVLYRANLIPERQRLAFLNLLQIPLRPALPATGLVAVDALPGQDTLPPLLPAETALQASDQPFHTRGDLQPTPLGLAVLLKERLDADRLAALGIDAAALCALYPDLGEAVAPAPYRPRHLRPGVDPLDLRGSLDGHFYLALTVPRAAQIEPLRRAVAGIVLNIGLAPEEDMPAERQGELPPRELVWELAQRDAPHEPPRWLTLDVVDDSSLGGRVTGVARLRLPANPAALHFAWPEDPRLAGVGDTPPEPPADTGPQRVLCWLRLRAADGERFRLGHLDVNAVEVVAQGVVRGRIVGRGTGQPEQHLRLPHAQIDAGSLALEVSRQGRFERWRPVPHFFGHGPDEPIYRLDPASGVVHFGDGLQGRRPPAGSLIRASYRYGGGRAGNLPPGSLTRLLDGPDGLRVRQEWPTRGGVDAESVSEAERRLPAELQHRQRAVTRADYVQLALHNPLRPVARAEAVPGLLPGATAQATRLDVPGVVSLFVLPPASPALGAAPRPTAGMLRDLYDHLAPRRPVGAELYVLSPQYVPLAVSVAVRPADPRTTTQTLRAVERALLEYLWPLPPGGPAGEGWPLGRLPRAGELRVVAARVAEVREVGAVRLFRRAADGSWQALPEASTLAPWQLPELQAASAVDTAGEPGPPAGSGGTAPVEGTAGQAVPIVPERC